MAGGAGAGFARGARGAGLHPRAPLPTLRAGAVVARVEGGREGRVAPRTGARE